MGCVRYRRGKWFLDYRDQYGIKRYKTTKYNRKEDKEKAIKQLGKQEIKVERGEYQDNRARQKFEDLVEVYRANHMNLNIRENTRKDYENRIKYHIEPYFSRLLKKYIFACQVVIPAQAGIQKSKHTGLRLVPGRNDIDNNQVILGTVH